MVQINLTYAGSSVQAYGPDCCDLRSPLDVVIGHPTTHPNGGMTVGRFQLGWGLLAVAMVATLTRPAVGQIVSTWTGPSQTGSSAADWFNTANWNPSGTYPGLSPVSGAGNAGDIAVFAGTNYTNVGVGLPDSNTSLSLGAISVTGSNGLVIGSNTTSTGLTGRSLTLNGATAGNSAGLAAGTLLSATGGNLTIQPAVGPGATTSPLGVVLGAANGTINVSTGRVISLSAVVADGGAGRGFTVTGGGTLALGGTNTFSGPIVVTGGSTVQYSVAANLGSAPATPTAGSIVLNGGTLDMTSFIGGTGIDTNRGVAVGPSSGAGGGTIRVSGGSLSYAGVVANNSAGTGSLTKTGLGSLTLTGQNTYSGGTSVFEGSTFVNNTAGSGTGTGSVTVTGFLATLRGTGTIAPTAGNSVLVTSQGSISGGDVSGVGSLKINSDLTVSSGTFSFQRGSIRTFVRRTGNGTATSTLLDLSGGSGFVNLNPGSGNQITLAFQTLGSPSDSLVADETYTVTLARVSASGGFRVNGVVVGADTVIDPSLYDVPGYGNFVGLQQEYALTGRTLKVDSTGRNLNMTFTVTPVPEPSAMLGLAAVACGAVVAARRWLLRRVVRPVPTHA